jgi:hypothetical protein
MDPVATKAGSSYTTLASTTSGSISALTPMVTSLAATKAGINHTTLVTIALAVSLVAVCLFSGACFWLYQKRTKESRILVNSQERFEKAELDTQELTIARKQSFTAELSAQTPRVLDLDPVELPATPLIIRQSRIKRKRANFF